MAFETKMDAKRFIVDKVLKQAKKDGVGLSNAELYNLSWSESNPYFKPYYELSVALEDDIGVDRYESKVAGLIRRVFEQDVAKDPAAKTLYREAYDKLGKDDHYILFMMKSALGLKLSKWWPF
jgi:hypothetical protein